MKRGVMFYIASRFWGGGEEYVFRLSWELKQRGWNVTFVAQENSEMIVVERFAEVGNVFELKIRSKNGKFSVFAGWQLWMLASKQGIRIVHVNAMKDYFVAVWAKIFSFGRLHIVATNHLVERAKSKLSWRWAYSKIDTLINVSECAKKEFLSGGVEKYFKNIVVLKNSVPDRKIYKLPQFENSVKVLYHGRVCEEKGIVALSKEWHRVDSKAILYVVGSGENIVGERILQFGFRTDVRDIVNQCDICIVPSLARESGGPLSLIEAMAAGKPVVASDNGSQPEYMRDGIDGFLCHAGNWDVWVDTINKLVRNKTLREQMGRCGREYYEKELGFQQFVGSIENIYEKII